MVCSFCARMSCTRHAAHPMNSVTAEIPICCFACKFCEIRPLPTATNAWMQFLQDSAMPDILANVCNNIRFVNPPANSSNFCQGFVYDDAKNTAFFKPQPASGLALLDTNNLCSSPTTHTWLRTQGPLTQSCPSCISILTVKAMSQTPDVGTAFHGIRLRRYHSLP